MSAVRALSHFRPAEIMKLQQGAEPVRAAGGLENKHIGQCEAWSTAGTEGAVGEWGVGAIIRCRTVCAEHKNKAAVRQPCLLSLFDR